MLPFPGFLDNCGFSIHSHFAQLLQFFCTFVGMFLKLLQANVEFDDK